MLVVHVHVHVTPGDVEAFLAGRIAWLAIPYVNAQVLDKGVGNVSGIADVLDADRDARERARSIVDRLAARSLV